MKKIPLQEAVSILDLATCVEVDGTYVRYHECFELSGEPGHVFLRVITPDPKEPQNPLAALRFEFREGDNANVKVTDGMHLGMVAVLSGSFGKHDNHPVILTPLAAMAL